MLTVMKTALVKMQISIDQPHNATQPVTAGYRALVNIMSQSLAEPHMVRRDMFPLDGI